MWLAKFFSVGPKNSFWEEPILGGSKLNVTLYLSLLTQEPGIKPYNDLHYSACRHPRKSPGCGDANVTNPPTQACCPRMESLKNFSSYVYMYQRGHNVCNSCRLVLTGFMKLCQLMSSDAFIVNLYRIP